MLLQKQIIMEKCRDFVSGHTWPPTHKLDPEGWLSNFTSDEESYALCLLDSFMYYGESLVDQMFKASFLSLLAEAGYSGRTVGAASPFTSRCCFTHVTGERPSCVDSGHIFTRKARQVLGFPESHLFYPHEAITKLCTNSFDVVIFVDDFVGSGEQMIETWDRPYLGDLAITFSQFRSSVTFYYIPLVATEYGVNRIRRHDKAINVRPSNILPDNFSAFSDDSLIWPAALRAGAAEFIRSASVRAGCSGRGFHGLGFPIAFYHSVPDATLPLYWHADNGWTPLIRRV